MTEQTFRQWLNFHGKHFPNVPPFLAKYPEVRETWAKSLSSFKFSLAELKYGTERLAAEASDLYPSHHLSCLIDYIQSRRERTPNRKMIADITQDMDRWENEKPEFMQKVSGTDIDKMSAADIERIAGTYLAREFRRNPNNVLIREAIIDAIGAEKRF